MKPLDYLRTYMRNSMNHDRFRPYIPGYAWPIKHFADKPKQMKKQTLSLKEYTRIVNRKKNWYCRSASMKATRKLLHKMRPKILDPLYREVQIRGTFHQPPYEQIKWSFIDMPDKIKEYLTALSAIKVQSIPVIITDTPSAVNHFERIEDTYLAHMNRENRIALPSEKVREAVRSAILATSNNVVFQSIYKVKFSNGIELSEPYPNKESVQGLSPFNFWIEDGGVEE